MVRTQAMFIHLAKFSTCGGIMEYTSGLSPDAERIEGSNPSESTCQPFWAFH